jgi:hypothetical protein
VPSITARTFRYSFPFLPSNIQEARLHKPQFRALIRNLHSLGLSDTNANVNACRKGDEPAIIWAADFGTPSVVKALLARGANVNARDKWGRTALHYAAWNGDITRANVRLLLNAGANVNAQDREGLTPLMVAREPANVRMLQDRRSRMTVRDETEIVLRPLIGQRLSDMWRAAGMQLFEIGVQRPFKNRKGKDVTKADWSFHVDCCWSITGQEGEIVSSDDFGPDATRRDENAKPFYRMLGDPALTITSIRADNEGGVRIQMSGAYVLDIWPCWEDAEPDDEYWRFLPKDENRGHFVMTASGIQRY